MKTSNKVVIAFNGEDLKALAKDEKMLRRLMQRESEHAGVCKAEQREAEIAIVGDEAEEEAPDPTRA